MLGIDRRTDVAAGLPIGMAERTSRIGSHQESKKGSTAISS
jgi:hypothetical protein